MSIEKKEKVYSFWEKNHLFSNIDIAIIGSGIVGLSTAIHLKAKFPQRKLVVIERESYPYGASTKNAGFSCFGSIGEILDDQEHMSPDEIAETIQWRWKGLKTLQSLVSKESMDYQNSGGYETFLNTESDECQKCSDSITELNKLMNEVLGLKETFSIVENSSSMAIKNEMILNQYEGKLNPILMINELFKKAIQAGVQFLWNFNVEEIEEHDNKIEIISSEKKSITTELLVYCTNAFSKDLHKDLDIKPYRNQVIMTKEIENLSFDATYHMNKGYIYFREYKKRILIGGARNLDLETESTDELGQNPKILDYLQRLLQETILPNNNFEIDHIWSGIIATGKTKKPIIKQLTERSFAAVRLGGMGVAIGTLVGKKITEIIN